MTLGRGAVVVVDLEPTIGHEQRGVRPCIVVSDPDVIGDYRFPLWRSFALIDQLRSIDKRRIRSVFGEIAHDELAATDEGLSVFLGISHRLHGADSPPVH